MQLASLIDIDKFREDVMSALGELNISQRDLAKEAELGHAFVSKLSTGTLKRPKFESVKSMCSVLGLDVTDYYPEGLPEEVPQEPPVEDSPVEETPVEEAHEQAEARLTALEETTARIKELEVQCSTLKAENASLLATIKAMKEKKGGEQKFTHAEREAVRLNDEIAELKNALSIKNSRVDEETRRADWLTVKLRADDKLILELLEFLARLKDGDVAQ